MEKIIINLERLEGYDEQISAYSAHIVAEKIDIGGLISGALAIISAITEETGMPEKVVLESLEEILQQNKGMQGALNDLLN